MESPGNKHQDLFRFWSRGQNGCLFV